jgi:hypothetical protein
MSRGMCRWYEGGDKSCVPETLPPNGTDCPGFGVQEVPILPSYAAHSCAFDSHVLHELRTLSIPKRFLARENAQRLRFCH